MLLAGKKILMATGCDLEATDCVDGWEEDAAGTVGDEVLENKAMLPRAFPLPFSMARVNREGAIETLST